MQNSFLDISILFLLAVFALLILYMAITELANFIQTLVPFVPTPAADIKQLVEKAGISKTDYFYDLGSGNGRVVFAVEQFSGAKSKGLQRAGWTQTYAKLRKLLSKSDAEFDSGDFFKVSWKEATVIYGYLYPPLMDHVGKKALQDCQPGTRLIMRDFPIKIFKPYEIWETPTGHTMYMYVI